MTALPAIACIGAGNMGSAIIAGLRSRDPHPELLVCDAAAPIRERHATAGLAVTDDPAATARCPVILLAIKPQGLATALAALRPHLDARHLVISILAGVPTATIEAGLATGVRVVRAMPNTPMAIGRGMVGICPGQAATDDDLGIARDLFAGAAEVLVTSEERMDAVTAVSGSGPAYLFRFVEAQIAAAIDLGFTEAEARTLVGTTVAGAAAYLASFDDCPADRLRAQVTSPGGTTAAALQQIDAADLDALMTRAMRSARDRGRELAGAAGARPPPAARDRSA